MANLLTKNPFYIDTVGATSIFPGRIHVSHVRWVGATTAGHHATILRASGAGNPIWDSVADGANFMDETYFDEHDWWDEGFQVSVLASGILYVYYR
jgi:hypothetical protein